MVSAATCLLFRICSVADRTLMRIRCRRIEKDWLESPGSSSAENDDETSRCTRNNGFQSDSACRVHRGVAAIRRISIRIYIVVL